MRPRHRAVLVAVIAVVAAGVVAALLGHSSVAIAFVVLLAGGSTVLLLQANRRAAEAVTVVQATKRDVRRLRKALDIVHEKSASAESVAHVRRQVTRTHKLVATHRTESATVLTDEFVPRLDGVQARVDGLGAELQDLRKGVAAVRSLVYAARPGKLLTQVQALDQLREKFDVSGPLPDVGGWALDPSALLWLVDEIERRRPKHVVECGSGTSTFWIATALRHNGDGRIISLDHLEEFAGRTRAVLERHGLTDLAEVRHAPLVDTATPRGTFPWYDVDPASIGPIDLLIVDGPPASTGRLPRYPALPVLVGALTPESYILVDDVHRKDERESVEHWLGEFPGLRRVGYTNDNTEVLAYG